MNCTLIIPYYRNPLMLRRQCVELTQYPLDWKVVFVDDGSPEPARPIIEEYISSVRNGAWSLYRIDVDIPWNREGARNLGSQVCETEWMVHVDIDHVLPELCSYKLIDPFVFTPNPRHFYRFCRFRVGPADETRKKDKLPPEQVFGAVHPHIDSYLCTKTQYWDAGGYNERMFSGILGGGSEFLRRLEKYGGKAAIAPADIHLHVYTRGEIADASDLYCSRDMGPVRVAERALRAGGSPKPGPEDIMQFPWHRIL